MLNLKSRLAEVVSSNIFKPFHPHLSYCPVASTVERLIASIIFFIFDIETEVLEECLPQCLFVYHKSHMTDLGLNLRPCKRKLATNRLNYSTAVEILSSDDDVTKCFHIEFSPNICKKC
jgi:hypothetical protein